MVFLGIAEVIILNNDHISIADLFEGAKAKVVDTELSHNHTAASAFSSSSNDLQIFKRTE